MKWKHQKLVLEICWTSSWSQITSRTATGGWGLEGSGGCQTGRVTDEQVIPTLPEFTLYLWYSWFRISEFLAHANRGRSWWVRICEGPLYQHSLTVRSRIEGRGNVEYRGHINIKHCTHFQYRVWAWFCDKNSWLALQQGTGHGQTMHVCEQHMSRGVATVEATEAGASVKNWRYSLLLCIIAEPGGRCGFRKLCTWYCRL
jgi:hypothetical protein